MLAQYYIKYSHRALLYNKQKLITKDVCGCISYICAFRALKLRKSSRDKDLLFFWKMEREILLIVKENITKGQGIPDKKKTRLTLIS